MIFTDPSGHGIKDFIKEVWNTFKIAYGSLIAEQFLYSIGEYKEYEKLSTETRDEKIAVTTFELGVLNLYYSIPAFITYAQFNKDYFYYNYFHSESISVSSDDITQIVSLADASLLRYTGVPKETLGGRMGCCGLASNIVAFEAENMGASSRIYQVKDILTALGVSSKESFQHAFTIVETENGIYLVDLSFSQFMDPISGLIRQNPVSSGISIHDPFAQQLLSQGYVELTQENLIRYLELTSSAGADVRSATLDILNTGILSWDYTVSELKKLTGR